MEVYLNNASLLAYNGIYSMLVFSKVIFVILYCLFIEFY